MKNEILYSEEAERTVLSNLLTNNENYYRADGKLKSELFWNSRNRALFDAIVSIIKDGQVADIVSVSLYFRAEKTEQPLDVASIIVISDYACTDITFLQHVYNLCWLYTRRKYFAFGQKLIEAGTDLSIPNDEIKLQLSNILNESDEDVSKPLSMADANANLIKRVEENMFGTSQSFIRTGFQMIDSISGFQCTDLNIIAAESSQGKTTWLINLLINAAASGTPSVIYSLEMNAMQLAARINSARCNLSSSTIQYKKLSTDQYQQVLQATIETNDLPISFDDKSTSNFESIVDSIHTIARKGKVKLFAIDYLQILCSTGNIQNQETFLGKVARDLKNLAKKYNVCIIALSQLKKCEGDPFPTLDRLRGSGQIRDAADNVFFIYRPDAYKKTSYHDFPNVTNVAGTAELIWAKGRNTGTGQCIVGFDAMTTTFYDGDFGIHRGGMHTETKEEIINATTPIPQPGQGALPF